MLKTPVKERAEAQTSDMSEAQKVAFTIVANDLHRLNRSVALAVETGLSVELQRVARHHAHGGYWGDLLIPVVVKKRGSGDLGEAG
jgi:hydrogenase maturation factor HypF (carbamoyltransferase family)